MLGEGRSLARVHRKRTYVLSAMLTIGIIVALASFNGRYRDFDPVDADIKNDWVVASALLDEVNPYSSLDGLAARYAGNEYTPPTLDPDYEGPWRTPRTPGAMVLGILWTPVQLDNLVQLNNLIGILTLVPVVLLVIWRRHHPGWQAISIFLLFSTGMLWSNVFSTVTPLIALAVTYGVISMRDGDRPGAGLAIGIAGTAKAFPLILLVLGVAYRRWRACAWAVGTLAVLNLSPLLMRHIHPGEAMDALVGASDRYGYLGGNMSLSYAASQVFSPAVGVATFVLTMIALSWWVIAKPTEVAADIVLLIGIAILLAPLSWPHYALAFYPVALMFILSPSSSPRIKVLGFVSLLLAFPTGQPWPGAVGILMMVLLAVITRIGRLTPLRRPLSTPVSAR